MQNSLRIPFLGGLGQLSLWGRPRLRDLQQESEINYLMALLKGMSQ